MKKVITVSAVLAATALAGGGAMLVAPTAQAVPVQAPSAQATPNQTSTGQAIVAAALPQAGHQTGYVQRGQTVTVYRDGKVQAKVTARSAAHPKGKGKLVLNVEAEKAFSFKAGEWLWEDPSGGDNEAVDTDRKISVPAKTTKTVSIRFDGVGNGAVIWAPDLESTAGAWAVKGKKLTSLAKVLPPGFVQRGSTVSVYKAGKVVARVTPRSATYEDGKGTLKLDVEAVKQFKVTPAAFIWENADGGDHKAVNGKKPVTVKAKTTQTITVNYKDVAAGDVIWTPQATLVAGAWAIG